MNVLRDAVGELVGIFRRHPDKYEASRLCQPVMEQITRAPGFLTAMLANYLAAPGSLDRGNYPAPAVPIDLNPWFSLSANCWVPLPDRATDLSTKAIHHHGSLLLTTATLFGPGYEHWTFTTPVELDRKRGLYAMDLIEAAPHPQHHVSFVDANIPHTPFFPPDLSVTLALFTSNRPTGWRDRVKRLPGIRGREDRLRQLAKRLHLGRALDVKIVDSYDYFPTPDGFRVMRERKEFRLGPNADHVASVFYILQRSGNAQLVDVVREQMSRGGIRKGRAAVEAMMARLVRGETIEPRLSPGHYDQPYANFRREDIARALNAVRKDANGRKLASAPVAEAAPCPAAE